MSRDPLRDEHEMLQRAVLASRRQFEQSIDSEFVREMKAATDEYLKAREAGVSKDDAVKGLELVLRSVWQKPVSKFHEDCEVCQDTGWQTRFCTHDMRCGRKVCREQHPSHEHRYVEPCACPAGDRFRPRGPATDPDDAIAQAARGKRKKATGWRQVGR